MKQITFWIINFSLLLSSCRAQTPSTPVENVIHPELKNIPVYPESTAWAKGIPAINYYPEDTAIYSYMAKAYKAETLVTYYEETMPDYGWDFLSYGSDYKVGNNKGTSIYFSKQKVVVDIQILEWTVGNCQVSVNFYDDPTLKEGQ